MTDNPTPPHLDVPGRPPPPADPVAFAKARRNRNIAIALGLVGFIVLVYLVTVMRMGGHIAERPL
ncbi:hypothetical protein GVN21_11415 [Caulobacter sp. SLTY]|uniref:hypothetical protein n=1 Tax=Caulobacter sp. SLTY TaxID=2683262 RepID=UPI001411F29C|nr:hypothetical protein [Caulobacter sp. SLTY]NBB15964.1 hypothetical protein [Caulobacter sp. SLTY]